MNDVHETLLRLQELDKDIREAESRLAAYEPELERLDAPVLELEKEIGSVRTRLEAAQTEIRRLERGAQDKRARQKKYEERLERVRNAREEAAARTELDLIRKAADADEREALQLMDERMRMELRLDELEQKLEEVRSELGPQKQELLDTRAGVQGELDALRTERQSQTGDMDSGTRRIYEQVKGGRTKIVLAALTEDGACGNCYSMVPIQKQTEIRKADHLIRCEACGVILYAQE